MCGIVYSHSFDGSPVNNTILDQFDAQRHRGTEGFGLFDGQQTHIVKASNENKILKWLCKYDSNLILFHHRFPTSTINVKRAAHPFSTKDYFGNKEYILVHNGSVYNADDLYDSHLKQGIRYQSLLDDDTFNDSESLLWDLALYLEGKQDKLEAYGGIAFIAIEKFNGKLNKMYFGRNTSPLNLFRDKDGIMLSSEGKGDSIEPNVLYTWNYNLRRLTKRPLDIDSWRTTNTCGYSAEDYEYKPSILPSQVYKKFQSTLLDIDRDVENMAMEYLIMAKGRFEAAYWRVEWDYDDAMDEYQYTGDYSMCRKLERVSAWICNHEEYLDVNSVSSAWRAIWQDNLLAM